MEEYRAFAKTPSLGLLHSWLIQNEVVIVEKKDGTGIESVINHNLCGEGWLRFFIPRQYLMDEKSSFKWMIEEKTPDQIMEGKVESAHNVDLDTLKKILQANAQKIRADIQKNIDRLLPLSDMLSRNKQEETLQEQRRKELKKIFADTDFLKAHCSDLDWNESNGEDSDGIAILVVIALKNLKCQDDSPEWEICYRITKAQDDRINVISYLEHRNESILSYETMLDLFDFLYSREEKEEKDDYDVRMDDTPSINSSNELNPYGRKY